MASNGRLVAPAQFPPAVDSQQEFIKHGLDDEDELIEVGVAIVGGGTAGLACWWTSFSSIRLSGTGTSRSTEPCRSSSI